ncbi:WD40-repeat-containing domain protein [Gorgonomyces haynaldii]|nr:WD40-repeat-containing domain protein [Gorgonomyces haynaldii]
MRPYSGNKKTETKSSPEPPSKVLRTRYVNGIDKTHDEFEDYLIQPWHIVQETVSNALGKKASKKSDEESDDKAQEIETESSTTPSSFLNTGVTLSHGFQLTKSMYHSLPTVRSVLYVPHSQQHVSLDSTHLHVWKGGNKIHRFSAVPPRDKIVQKSNRHSKDSYLPGLAGLSEWIYLEKYRMYVVATKQLELKLLDLHFDEIFSYSNPMPILSLAHDPSSGDIICGEVGGIRAFRLNVGPLHQGSPSVTERLHIPLPEEWCTCVYYDRMWNRIFGACGTNLYVFDFVNGERLDNYYDIHELTITCIAFYEPMEYLITGAKDGTIKIRNARKYLLFDFHEHFNAVTGFLLMETVCEANRGTLPLLISSSLDCTIRMWNFETGQSLYRLDVSEPCLGIGMIKKHYFHHFCPSSIQIWNVNRYQHTFAFFRSKPQILRRMTEENKPSRILTSTADSSIKLISPVTGATLSTGFPSHTEATVRYVAYNMKREMLSRNPNHEPFMCCTEANYYRYKPGRDKAIDSRLVQDGRLIRDFYLFFGTASGQIVGIDVHGKERKEYAHSAAIDKLRYDSDHVLLLSGGKDKIIKVWEPRFSFERPQLSATRGKQDLLLVTHLHCVATVNIQAADFNTCAFSIFPSRKQFAVPFNGGIIIGEYDRDNTLEQRPFNAEEQSVGKVLFIDVIEEFGYYAAANSDNTVKIWDQKMRLVREIQFNEPIASMCIANKRGDLLVGLSDQISLVRIQDYIPPNVLQTMITKELTDDIQEAPLAFDSQLEFWNLQYEKESSKGIVEDWHMTKNVQQMPKFDEQDSLEALLEISRQRRAEAQKKMNKRKFLEDELQAYLRSLNEKLAYLKGEEEQNNLGSQEWPSQPALVELMEPSTPTHEKVFEITVGASRDRIAFWRAKHDKSTKKWI